jgi:hypothetical protein
MHPIVCEQNDQIITSQHFFKKNFVVNEIIGH